MLGPSQRSALPGQRPQITGAFDSPRRSADGGCPTAARMARVARVVAGARVDEGSAAFPACDGRQRARKEEAPAKVARETIAVIGSA